MIAISHLPALLKFDCVACVPTFLRKVSTCIVRRARADFDCTLSRGRVPRLQKNDPKEGRSGSLRDVRPIFELCMVGIVRRQSGSSSGILAGRARLCLTLVKTEFYCEMSAPLGWREPCGFGAGSEHPAGNKAIAYRGPVQNKQAIGLPLGRTSWELSRGGKRSSLGGLPFLYTCWPALIIYSRDLTRGLRQGCGATFEPAIEHH